MKLPPPRTFNPKRRVDPSPSREALESLLGHLRYTGNPAHKRNPGDFGLTPPAAPRPDKTLCDLAGIFSRERALESLRAGAAAGLISVQRRGDFPQNIWWVDEDGVPLEAQLENEALGEYHGYPIPEELDPFGAVVLAAWRDRVAESGRE